MGKKQPRCRCIEGCAIRVNPTTRPSVTRASSNIAHTGRDPWPADIVRSPIDLSLVSQPHRRSQEHHINAGAVTPVLSCHRCHGVLLSSRIGVAIAATRILKCDVSAAVLRCNYWTGRCRDTGVHGWSRMTGR